jgi:hypothetical protein
MATITEATLYLWIYTGTLGSKPATPNYVLQKNVKAGDDVITFEIAELVKDYVNVNFTGNYNSIVETAWVEWTMVQNFDDSSTNTESDKAIATNGYGYFKDGVNPVLAKGALINNDKIYNYTGQNIYLPIYTGEDGAYKADYYNGNTLLRTDTFGAPITSITADTTNFSADTIDITADSSLVSGISSEVITRVTPPSTTDRIVVTRHTGATETILVETIEECKYTPYKVSFLNQYGVVQDLWFFKRRNEGINITKGQYLQNTIQESISGVSYSLNQASKIPTDFKVTKNLKLNTGFVNENHNEIIQELMLTESAWIHEGSNVFPIVPTTSNLEYKTQLNDKLINFTVDFEYAYNEINLIK